DSSPGTAPSPPARSRRTTARRGAPPPPTARRTPGPWCADESRLHAGVRRDVIGDPRVHLGRREAAGRGAPGGGVERHAHDARLGRELLVASGHRPAEPRALIPEPRGHL